MILFQYELPNHYVVVKEHRHGIYKPDWYKDREFLESLWGVYLERDDDIVTPVFEEWIERLLDAGGSQNAITITVYDHSLKVKACSIVHESLSLHYGDILNIFATLVLDPKAAKGIVESVVRLAKQRGLKHYARTQYDGVGYRVLYKEV